MFKRQRKHTTSSIPTKNRKIKGNLITLSLKYIRKIWQKKLVK